MALPVTRGSLQISGALRRPDLRSVLRGERRLVLKSALWGYRGSNVTSTLQGERRPDLRPIRGAGHRQAVDDSPCTRTRCRAVRPSQRARCVWSTSPEIREAFADVLMAGGFTGHRRSLSGHRAPLTGRKALGAWRMADTSPRD